MKKRTKMLAFMLAAALSFSVVTPGTQVMAGDTEGQVSQNTETEAVYELDNATTELQMAHLESNAKIVVNGDEIKFTFTSKSSKHDRVYIGKKSEMQGVAEGIAGTPIYDEDAEKDYYNDGNGKVIGYSYEVPITQEDFEAGEVYYALKYRADYVDSKGSSNRAGTYSGSKDYKIEFGKMRRKLEIQNNTGMFKVAEAYIETKDNKNNLVITMSGTGYQKLFKGTYEEAVATERDKSSWIQYQEDESKAFQFVIPLEKDETYIPIVAISARNERKVDENESLKNYASAFYPRQAEINYEAGTLVTGDYDHEESYTVEKEKAEDFKVQAAKFHTVSGPNSNAVYKNILTLAMENEEYDKLALGSAETVNESNAIALEGKQFTIEFAKDVFKNAEAMQVAAHRVKDNKWYDMNVTVDKLARTIAVENKAPELKKPEERKPTAIAPAGTSLKKVKAGKKMITVSWKAQKKGSSGYEIQYSTDKKFKKNTKIKSVTKNTVTSTKITKLKSKKNYYVRVRTYKNIKQKGKTIRKRSGWSKVKSVKVK